MSTLVVGSVALDTVQTPFGRAEEALGGTAVYFSLAAALFGDVRMVGVVGDDFPAEAIALLEQRGIDLGGLQRRPGETFRWVGAYGDDMNTAHTLDTQLNVFETFHPTLPPHYRDARLVFLGNIDPELQLDVLEQMDAPAFTALDTMNFWIDLKKDALLDVIRRVDAVLINEGELRQLTGQYNVLSAAGRVQELGPRHVVVKRGEYGALMFSGDDVAHVPAYPTYHVRDTTGAGDSFAGGFLGYLDSCSSHQLDDLRAALVYGTVMASFTVEDFSISGLRRATPESLCERYARLAEITRIVIPEVEPDLVPEGV
ncbi:MAG TPA: PfkB family carbohydrate kinase [Chloroflexota bacterium]|nr:PfkB family carbohydrate kinase [Chloroflexota bacterium]